MVTPSGQGTVIRPGQRAGRDQGRPGSGFSGPARGQGVESPRTVRAGGVV